MNESYKFYVKMDGDTFGPYSAKEVRDLDLLDDILVTEESMNGQWLPASKFDFDDMVRKEGGDYYQPSVQEPQIVQQTYQPQNPSSGIRINTDGSITNQSGWNPSYSPSEVPSEIKKWNWGAFFFNWIWGLCNGVYWPLVLIICNFIPYVGPVISLGCCIALGINGSEWAWKGKRWNSIEHFKQVQHNWALACLWVFGICLVLGFIGAIAAS